MTQAGEWLLSFDPGGTTGYARHFLRDKGISLTTGSSYDYQESWSGGQLEPQHHVKLWSLLSSINPNKIICESFDNPNGLPGINLISRNYIGIIELYCELTHKPLIMQSSAIKQAKWLDDDALNRLGIRVPGQPHRNDASRHMLYYIVETLGRKDILKPLKVHR